MNSTCTFRVNYYAAETGMSNAKTMIFAYISAFQETVIGFARKNASNSTQTVDLVNAATTDVLTC